MDLATFKEIHRDKSPSDRFCTIIKTMMYKESDMVAWAQAGNEEDREYYMNEAKAMDDRSEWLYFGLLKDLDELERRRKRCSGWRKRRMKWATESRRSRRNSRRCGA